MMAGVLMDNAAPSRSVPAVQLRTVRRFARFDFPTEGGPGVRRRQWRLLAFLAHVDLSPEDVERACELVWDIENDLRRRGAQVIRCL